MCSNNTYVMYMRAYMICLSFGYHTVYDVYMRYVVLRWYWLYWHQRNICGYDTCGWLKCFVYGVEYIWCMSVD